MATAVRPGEVPTLIDELPLFALAASMARGRRCGARELRAKSRTIETDKCAEPLARIAPSDDGFRGEGVPTRLKGGGAVSARGDHRIAMLGAIGGLVSREGVTIEDAESVTVSFPEFFDLLDSVTQR